MLVRNGYLVEAVELDRRWRRRARLWGALSVLVFVAAFLADQAHLHAYIRFNLVVLGTVMLMVSQRNGGRREGAADWRRIAMIKATVERLDVPRVWEPLVEPGPEVAMVRGARGQLWVRGQETGSRYGWVHLKTGVVYNWLGLMAYAPLTDVTSEHPTPDTALRIMSDAPEE